MYGYGSEMDDAPIYRLAEKIKIVSADFDKGGCLMVDYFYNKQPGSLYVEECFQPWDDLIPKEEGQYLDEFGYWNATLDDFHCLHWHCKKEAGNVVNLTVPLYDFIINQILRKHE